MRKIKMRSDPTRTQVLRNEYARRAIGHYKAINKDLIDHLQIYLNFSDINLNTEDYKQWMENYIKQFRIEFMNQDVDFYLKRAYEKGMERAAQEGAKVGISISTSWSILDHEAYNNLFSISEGLYEKLDSETAYKTLYVIRQGVLNGNSIPQIAQALKDTLHFNLSRAEMIARTEIIRAYNTAALNRYKLYTKKVQWLAAIDERTCEKCASLDGKVFNINDLEPPPIHPRCYSEDTEVFTAEGWKLFKDLRGDEKIWSLNPQTGEMELTGIKCKIAYYYDGDMYHFKGHTIDLLVTPDHNMPVRPDWRQKHNKNSPLMFREARNMKYGDVMPRTALKWVGKNPKIIKIGNREFPAKEFMAFLGWYVSEGSISKPKRGDWQIKIAQEKEDNRKEIIILAKKLFPKTWVGERAIYIPHMGDIKDYFLAMGKAADKHLPPEIKEYSKELLWEFLLAYIKGDGSIRNRGWKGHPEWQFKEELVATTSSKRLVDDLTEIALKLGLRPNFRVEMPRTNKFKNGIYTSKKPQWYISFGWHKYSYYRPQLLKIEKYDGMVYDVELEKNHILFVRRNGKTIWSGNCRCTIVPVW